MEQFEKVIMQMIALFEEYLPLEQEKLKAAQESNVAALEDCMTREQAVVLKLRGLEQKRETVQKQNGWEGKTFREIVELVPDEKKRTFQELFEKLATAITMFQSANESALDTINIHLREINKAIKEKDQSGTYSQEGSPMNVDRPMTNQKV